MRAALLTAIFLLAPAARAEEKPSVTLTIDACVEVDANDVRKIVEIELHTTIADTGLTRVSAKCRDTLIDLVVEDSVTGKSLMRTVDIAAQAPKARARLLALAIAELVSASWTELETNPTPAVPPAGPPPPPAAKKAARAAIKARIPEHPLRVLALLDRRAFLARTAWVTGLGVRVAQDGALVGWSAEMVASQGTAGTSLGDVAIDLVGVALGVTFNAHLGDFTARGAAGARFGAARLSGVPRGEDVEGRSVRGAWGGPYLGASISYAPFKPFIVEASIDSGYVVAPVHASVDGTRAVSVAGVWIAGAIALGVTL